MTVGDEPFRDRAWVSFMLSGEQYENEANIRCPVCDFNCSHIRRVFTSVGTDPYEGWQTYPGTEAGDISSTRRGVLVIVFDGECGHAWTLEIEQHKGINLLRGRVLESPSQGEEE